MHTGPVPEFARNLYSLPRNEGLKVGFLRPITLFPFPSKRINELAGSAKIMLSVEMSAGQMVEDVLLSVNGKVPVYHFGRMGGIVTTPEEVVELSEIKNYRRLRNG